VASLASERLCERVNELLLERPLRGMSDMSTPLMSWRGSVDDLEAKLVAALEAELEPEPVLETAIGLALRANLRNMRLR